MEFWGVEVKPGEPLKIRPELFKLIHLSQAALGEVKDGNGPNRVLIHLKVGDKKFVVGTLSAEDRPQLMFDLVFEKEFELSHDWKDGSIYFAGYVADESDDLEVDSDDEDFSDDDEDEDNQLDALLNGKSKPEVVSVKAATNKILPIKPKASENSTLTHVGLKKDEPESDGDDDGSDVGEDGEDSSELEEDSSDALPDTDSEDFMDDGSDDENGDLESKRAEPVKKRSSETASEMLAQAAKKTKSLVPEKSGGKTPATSGKSKGQSPKSGGQFSNKSFKTKNAHTKAKHGGK